MTGAIWELEEEVEKLKKEIRRLKKRVSDLETRRPRYVPPPVYGPPPTRSSDLSEFEKKKLNKLMKNVTERANRIVEKNKKMVASGKTPKTPLKMSEAKPGWLFSTLAKTEQASKELDDWLMKHPEAGTWPED